MRHLLRRTILTGAAMTLFAGSNASMAQDAPSLPEKAIAIVRDGDSWYFDGAVDRFMARLESLAEGKYRIRRVDFDCGYDAEKVEATLRQVLSDPEIDLVYAAGVIATERAAGLDESVRTKPVMGGSLQFTNARGQPISSSGTSSIKNYTFITQPQRVATDIELLLRLSGADAVSVLIDGVIVPELKNLEEGVAAFEKEFGVGVRMIESDDSAARTLARIPAGVEAMYVGVQMRMDAAEREKLYAGLAERGIVTVAMVGRREVDLKVGDRDAEAGALAGLAPDDRDAVARRTASNVHQLLNGISTDSLPVYLPVADHFVINAATALKAGWSPDYDTLLEADMLRDDVLHAGEPVTLDQALERAAKRNADVEITREEEAIADEEARIAGSFLLPQVNAGGQHGVTRTSDRIDPMMTPERVHQGAYGVELQQILFNDEIQANRAAQRIAASATRLDTRSSELDAMEQVALAYFDYLTAQALYKIEKENLRLTENNYQLAVLRRDIGAADSTEVFRWEQDRARSRANLFQRDADRADALVQFNRIIAAPRTARWNFGDVTLGDQESGFLDNRLKEVIRNAREWREFGLFLMFQAVENSPEVALFDQTLEAQGIVLRQKRRAHFLPEVAGSAQWNRVVQGTDVTETDDQGETFVGVSITLPLFDGGLRKAEAERQAGFIRQLEAQRERAIQQIEQRTLSAVNGMSGSHPNIRLSREALEAAEKNYQSVEEKYSQGAASILDILDAQAALLQQKQQEAVAVYSYLKDLYSLQRSIAWFEFEQSSDAIGRFIDQLQLFLEDGTIITRHGQFSASGREPSGPAGQAPAEMTAPPDSAGDQEPPKRSRRFPWKRK